MAIVYLSFDNQKKDAMNVSIENQELRVIVGAEERIQAAQGIVIEAAGNPLKANAGLELVGFEDANPPTELGLPGQPYDAHINYRLAIIGRVVIQPLSGDTHIYLRDSSLLRP